MVWVILIVVILLLMAKKTAQATTTAGPGTEARLMALADAIAGIEGGSPENPGNIKDSTGNIAQSADLMRQLRLGFVTGGSRYYSPEMTFRELAWMWVCGAQVGQREKCDPRDDPDAWALYVAARLGVDPDSPVGAWLNS